MLFVFRISISNIHSYSFNISFFSSSTIIDVIIPHFYLRDDLKESKRDDLPYIILMSFIKSSLFDSNHLRRFKFVITIS